MNIDTGNAVVLGLVLVGLVTLVHTLIVGPNADRIKAAVCLVVSLVAVLLVAASDFAHTQVILDRPLDQMNFGSQLVVAVLLAGVASGVWQGFKAVANVGENQTKMGG